MQVRTEPANHPQHHEKVRPHEQGSVQVQILGSH